MNKKKKRKVIILSCILTILIAFNGILVVKGDNSVESGDPGTGDRCTTGRLSYSASRRAYGVRIALVDENGDLLSGSHIVDIIPSFDTSRINTSTMKTYNGSINLKKDITSSSRWGQVSKGSISDILQGQNTNLSGGWAFWLSDIQSSYTSNTAIQKLASLLEGTYKSSTKENFGANLKNVIQSFDSYLTNLYNNDYEEFTKEMNLLFTFFGSTVTWDEADPNQTYVQYEPIIIQQIGRCVDNGNRPNSYEYTIYGTPSELYTAMNTSYSIIANSTSSSALRSSCFGIWIKGDKYPSSYQSTSSAFNCDNGLGNIGTDLKANGLAHMWLGKYERDEVTKCSEILKYIKNNKPKSEWATLAAKLYNGTFYETVTTTKNGTTTTTIYNASVENNKYDLLLETNYTSNKGTGKPQCKNMVIDECSATADTNIDACTTGTTYFKDDATTSAWLECGLAYGTYSSENTGHEASITVSFKGETSTVVGNSDYCKLYCYEEVSTSFPTSVSNVKAGQTFFWGKSKSDGTFGSISIKKVCSNKEKNEEKSEGYLFNKWYADYLANEKSLVTNYLEYQINTWANNNAGFVSSTTDCDTCCITWETRYTDPNDSSTAYQVCTACGTAYTYKRPSDTLSYGDDSTWFTTSGIVDNADTTATKCSRNSAKSALSVDTTSYSNAYHTAVLNESKLMIKILQCTQNLKYVYNTTVYLIFKEPINSVYGANSRNFTYNGELEVTPSKTDGYNKKNVDTSSCTEKTVYSYECTGEGKNAQCKATSEKVYDCTQVTWEINGTWTYQYPSSTFTWFSVKKDDTLVNESGKPSMPDSYFYSIGFGLPTAFSLTSGVYTMKVDVGNLGDNATTTGAQQYNTTNGHFAPLTTVTTNGQQGFEYECTYTVDNEIFGYDCQYSGTKLTGASPEYCDTKKDSTSNGSLKGLDISYRIVSLLSDTDSVDKAFPGKDGTGRVTGENWVFSDEKLHELLNADVYNSSAMYELMLDVNAIQYIRKDNQTYLSAGLDPYTSYYDKNNQLKIICASKGTDGEYKYCASDFLTELQTSSKLNYNLMGTCLPAGLSTEARAQDVLNNGCYTTYTYPTVQWTR